MISYSDGTTIYTPKYSMTHGRGLYVSSMNGSSEVLSAKDMWIPTMHLGRNTSIANSPKECVFPSSLVHYVRTTYPNMSHKPSIPMFQFAKTQRLANFGYAKFNTYTNSPFHPSDGGFCSHLWAATTMQNTNIGYAYIQPLGYVNNASVITNQTAYLNGTYTVIDGDSGYINLVHGPSTGCRFSEMDHLNKVLTDATDSYQVSDKWCHVALNFNISLHSNNYDLVRANLWPDANCYGISIPIEYYYRDSSMYNDWYYYVVDDLHLGGKLQNWHTDSAGTLYLDGDTDGSSYGFIRMNSFVAGGYTPDARYYHETMYGSTYTMMWLSGQFHFKVQGGYGSSCPYGYTGIQVGSPIVSLRMNPDYLLDSSNHYGEVWMCCAETVEVYAEH